MKFKRHSRMEYGLTQIDIAPLINVMFLLLIFFMFSSNFMMQPGLTVDLPKTLTSEIAASGSLELTVSAQNVISLDAAPLTFEEARRMVTQAAKRGQPVLIKSDRKASLGRVVELWDMARDAGAPQVSIASTQE